ncbi:MAG: DNA methyltransferase [Sulfuricaulis sp.]|nr:DNA methyltransferase [Sulfuricaulis sp.]
MGGRVEQIGNATLILGDALEVLPTLDAGSVHMVFTDPPYGHNNNNGDLIHRWEAALGRLPGGEDSPLGRPIANDGAEANDLFRAILPELNRALASKGCCCCCCCCGGGGPDPQFARWSLWLDEVFAFKQMVIWDKGPMGMGWHYRRSYETVLVAEKRGGSRWYDETDRIENIIRPGQYGIRKIIPDAEEHPTPKPPALAAHFMRLHTRQGETVLDPFMGRGSTGEAAMGLGRRFIGIEIDPKWFDASCERIENAQRQLRMFA